MHNVNTVEVNGHLYGIEDTVARSIMSGLNLLHNWNFRNPVNERRQSEYTGGGYAFDRWFIQGNVTATIVPGGIRITNNNTTVAQWLLQPFEPPIAQLLHEQTITVSIETIGGSIVSRTGVYNVNLAGGNIPANVPGGFAYVSSDGGGIHGWFGIHIDPGQSIEVSRVKLELGPVSTLANDPPMDFGRELAICQRFQIFVGAITQYVGYVNLSRDILLMDISLPVTLRAHPAVIDLLSNTSQFIVWMMAATGVPQVFTATEVLLAFRSSTGIALHVRLDRPAAGFEPFAALRGTIRYPLLLDANL